MKHWMKCITLILCLFCLCGCSVVYNLDLTEDNLKEQAIVSGAGTDDPDFQRLTAYPLTTSIDASCFLDYDSLEGAEVKEPGVKYYDVESDDKETKLSTRFKKYNYQDSRIANNLFNSMNVNNYDQMFSIYGFNGLLAFDLYPELEKVTVNITVDKKVVEHDADKVSGNTYTWFFDRKTKKSKTLYIEVDPQKEKTSDGSLIKNNIVLIILLVLALLAGMIYLIRKYYTNNKSV